MNSIVKEKFNINQYAIIEVVAVQRSHTHVKGATGGVRTNVVEELKNLDIVKRVLNERSKIQSGPLVSLLAKAVAPMIKMAQSLMNQPVEAFLGGVTSCVP
jgi:predicted GTPase